MIQICPDTGHTDISYLCQPFFLILFLKQFFLLFTSEEYQEV